MLVGAAVLGVLLALRQPVMHWAWRCQGTSPLVAPLECWKGMLLVEDEGGLLSAVEASSGSVLWQRSLLLGGVGALACGAGRVWLVDGQGILQGRSLVTGAEEVRWPLGSQAGAGVAVVEGMVYVATDDKRLVRVRAWDGEWLGEQSLPDAPLQPLQGVVGTNLLLLPTRHGFLLLERGSHALRAQMLGPWLWGKGCLAEGEFWRGNERGELYRWRTEANPLRWRGWPVLKAPHPFEAAPWVDEEWVLAGTVKGKAFCLERTSGRVLWEARTRGGILARPVRVGETTYWATLEGWLEARALANGRLLWRIALGAPVGADLLTDGQRLYFATWKGTLGALLL